MEEIGNFSLEVHQGPYENWPRKSRLYFNDTDTLVKIPGYDIEAQYKNELGYLLITSHDCPFEESNEFIFLDFNYRVLAANELLVDYGTYLLYAHWPTSSNTLRLHYLSEEFYDLSIKNIENIFGRSVKIKLSKFRNYEKDPKALNSILKLKKGAEQIANELTRHNSES